MAEAKRAIGLARDIFPRLSFDLIYARPGQTIPAWEAELAEDQIDHDEQGPDVATDTVEDAPLTNHAVRDSMRQNLAALAMLAEPGVQPQIVRSGETSLEGLVRDLLRPMLAEWLDANLPGMVEKMVKAEISRIAGKRS